MTYKIVLFALLSITGWMIFPSQEKDHSSTSNSFNTQQPKELGKVTWLRDIQQAKRQSKKNQKPIFLLFQEVPGCATCQNYGQQVLSHPLIVEAIETYFVPLAIFNNKGGKDREVLKYFNEPTWNNPVVRFIDHNKNNLRSRLSGNYTSLGIVNAMMEVMKKQKVDIPNYLSLLQTELNSKAKGTETAYLSMYCFWTGEKEISGIDGVIETQAGFMNGREIVKTTFDPTVVSYESLLQKAQRQNCASHVFTESLSQEVTANKVLGSESTSDKKTFRPDKETKYYLYKSSYQYIPMTSLQAAKANRLIGKGQAPDSVLSPRQIQLLDYIRKHPAKPWENAINKNIIAAWASVDKQVD